MGSFIDSRCLAIPHKGPQGAQKKEGRVAQTTDLRTSVLLAGLSHRAGGRGAPPEMEPRQPFLQPWNKAGQLPFS